MRPFASGVILAAFPFWSEYVEPIVTILVGLGGLLLIGLQGWKLILEIRLKRRALEGGDRAD